MIKGRVKGVIRKDKKTKSLIPRLRQGEIALLSHRNIDDLAALALIEKRVGAILNTDTSVTGDYVVYGAELLLRNGVPIIEDVPKDWMEKVVEGEIFTVDRKGIKGNGLSLSQPHFLTLEEIQRRLDAARAQSLKKFEAFVENTLHFLRKEKAGLFPDFHAIRLNFPLKKKEVVVVVRGKGYKEDLNALSFFIKDRQPVLIGVDGGADAILEAALSPNIIVGDMDSVSAEALHKAMLVVAHAYPDGSCPAKERLEELGISSYEALPFAGTSEDLALMMAYAAGAKRIVGVGMHFSMDEFLGKGREGMASTFLARLRVGHILFDAKGISEIYRPNVPPRAYLLLLLSVLFTTAVVLFTSPYLSPFLRILRLYLKQIGGS